MARIVVAYLRKHPEELHMNGGRLIAAALMETYPCNAKKKTGERL